MQLRGLVRMVVCVVVAALGFAPAGAAGVDDATSWLDHTGLEVVHLDGDGVVLAPRDTSPTAAKGSGSSSAVRYHDGFSTFGDAVLLVGYEVRLVASPGIEQVQPYVAAAVEDARAVGPSLVVRAHPVERMGPARGQIDVVVSGSSPCRGYWLACGGPTIIDGVVQSGQIWINPRLLGRAHGEIINTVRHEFGHTMGLGHYDALHHGEVQVMHSRRFDASTYRGGDRAGLSFNTHRGGPVVTLDRVGYAAGTLRVGGGLSRVPPSATLRISAADHAVHRAVAGSGYANSIRVRGGPLHVCVAVEHGGEVRHATCADHLAPTAPFGVLETVVGGVATVRSSGWAIDPQTAAPIAVDVVIDGRGQAGVADRPRPDVAATYPAYGERHGFRVTRYVTPGVHDVCVVARDVGGGADEVLGCHTVRVGLSGAGL